MKYTLNYPDRLVFAANQNIKERDYWLEKLADSPAKVNFPYDYRKSGKQSKGTVKFCFTGHLYSRLMTVVNKSDVRLHITLVAGLAALIYRYSGSSDIIVGTPVYKTEVAGEFINTVLALRNRLEENTTFKALLLQVRETIKGADEHQDYPIEVLCEQLNMPTAADDFPLFDMALLLENIQDKECLRHIPLNMIFSFLRTNDALDGTLEYNSSLYQRTTVERIVSHLECLLARALYQVDLNISRIEFQSQEDKKQVLYDFNRTGMGYGKEKLIHELFEKQARRIPTNIAVRFKEEELSFKELDDKSNQLAGIIRKKGIKRDGIVGIMMDYSLEMIIAILGILKAGGAYLPIDPDYPGKRIISILNDSAARLLITKEKAIKHLSFTQLQNFQSNSPGPKVTAARPQIEDINQLQMVDRSIIDYERYLPFIGQSMVKNSITLQYSRGCVYNCAFCFKIWSGKYVSRTAENMFEEILCYYKMGIRRFGFVDDLPNLNVKETAKLYRLIIKNKLDLQLHYPNGIRGDILDKEYIDLMVEAGAITMDLALETTSPRLQKLIKKNLNLEKLHENMKYIIETYPHVIIGTQLLHGIPTETEEEARASLSYLERLKWLHFVYIHLLKIYPNTGMARLAISHGISREIIEASASMGYHELPDTLPFPKNFTRQYQAEFLNHYFLCKERLLHVLPYQMKALTEDELVQKYNSYLPVEIKNFPDFLKYAGIGREELKGEFLEAEYGKVPGFNGKLKEYFSHLNFSQKPWRKTQLRLLMLDLTQHFSHEMDTIYEVVEPPLGLMYLVTSINRKFGPAVRVKIAKSRIDFDGFEELKNLIKGFKPDLIGIRTLNFYKDFFHKTAALIGLWASDVPIIAGGPYATSSYQTMLKDRNIDIAVLGEGEITFNEIIEKILENNGRLPDDKVLTTIPGIAFIEQENKLAQDNRAGEIILLDRDFGILEQESGRNPGIINQPNDLAYTIYTSGSTGKPKGVLIQHNNLVNQVEGLVKTFGFDSSLNYMLLAPYTFDVSVMHIFLPLITGAKLFLIPEDVKKDSQKLWQVIQEKKISVLNIVPAFMQVLLKNVEKKKVHLKYLFVGGDVFSPNLYRDLEETLAVEKIINIYGPTEATINTTTYECKNENKEAGTVIPIGKPLPNYFVYIMDNHWNPVPIGGIGQLCISGKGAARGYLNNPELTNSKFQIPNKKVSHGQFHASMQYNSLSPQYPITPLSHHPIYLTGDMAKWLPDGNIEFAGRQDKQVKIRGYRIELAEIEKQLLSHDSITGAIVLPQEDDNKDKHLYAYYVSEKQLKVSELREYLSRELPGYFIPSYFVPIEKIPLTSNGKVERKALSRYKPINTGEVYIAPGNEIEEKLAEIMQNLMEIEKVGINDNFFALGGDSIKAIQVVSRLQKYNLKLEITHLLQYPTIAGMSRYVKVLNRQADQKVVEGEVKLSPIQEWFYRVIKTDRHHWNHAVMLYGKRGFEKDKIAKVFSEIVKHHDALRMVFQETDKGIVSYNRGIEDNLLDMEVHNLSGQFEYEGIILEEAEKVQRSFNLVKGPLLKLRLFKTGNGDHLLIVVHHLVIDGISWRIIFEDFDAGYRQLEHGQEIAFSPKTTSFKEWSESLHEYANGEYLLKEKEYWKKLEKVKIPGLPKDNYVGQNKTIDGISKQFVLSEEYTEKLLKELPKVYNTEINDILLTALAMALKDWTGNDKVLVNLESHGREEIIKNVDISRTVGWFAVVYPVILHVGDTRNYSSLIKNTREMLKTIPNKGSDYFILKYLTPGEHKRDIEFSLKPEIHFNYLGQFDVDVNTDLFGVSNIGTGLPISLNCERINSLTIGGFISEGCLQLTLEYNQHEYRESTILKFWNSYENYLLELIDNIGEEDIELTPGDFSDPGIGKEEIELISKLVENI